MRDLQAGGRAPLSILERAAIEELDHTPAGLSRLERLLIAAIVEIGRMDSPVAPPPLPHFATLTARERDVLRLIVEGQTNKGASRILKISDRTVEIHRLRIQRKLGVRNTAELIRLITESTDRGGESADGRQIA